MSTVDVSVLLAGQRDIQGRISRSVDNLKKMGAANINLSAVETRISLLDQLWAKFEAQHEQIRANLKDKYSESEYVKTDFFDGVEIIYVRQRSALNEYALQLRAVPAAPPAGRTNETAPRAALPRIKLPQFSGAFDEWPSFRDLFLSVVGTNPSISNVERLHYLRSSLQGPAERLIRSLTVTAENYDRAWTLLTTHFENKRELIRSNFATFTAVGRMKGATSDELDRIYNAAIAAANAQESIGRPIQGHGMDLFSYLVVELFDSRTRLEWESHISGSPDPPQFKTLTEFMSRRVLTLKAAHPENHTKDSKSASKSARSHFAKAQSDSRSCVLCKGKHILMLCDSFKAKTAIERKAVVEANRLCFNCLGTHQVAKCQSKRNCMTCQGRHHTLLHAETAKAAGHTDTGAEANTLCAMHASMEHKAILLATARVGIADRFGTMHPTRALIDQGSEISLISEALVQKLRLPRSRSAVTIVGIGGTRSGPSRGQVTVRMTSQITGAELSVVAVILPRLSLYQGATSTSAKAWTHIADLPLADPTYFANDPVELLLGAEVCAVILENGIRRGGPRLPIAQKTKLGWILSGGCADDDHSTSYRSNQCTVECELTEAVNRFWEQEREPDGGSPLLTPLEERCERIFVDSHSRTSSGRYMVRLPFVSAPPPLTLTRRPAERLLTAMERKFELDRQFAGLYRDFMAEYEDLKHMAIITAANGSPACYLPHHGVLRKTTAAAKIRVVFNGSQRTAHGDSLNAQLLTGANLLPPLADILARWRQHRYVFVTDIEKMYRQILVHPEDRRFQTILWRPHPRHSTCEYELQTVTYGLACAPFLAIRTIHQLATDEGERFPRGSVALRRDCYVDDIVTGADTLDDAVALQAELRALCTAGGFPLRKWAANHDEILAGVPADHQVPHRSRTWEGEIPSTLGLRWHPTDDTFAFTIGTLNVTEFTKRRVLSETARLFDPLGWLSPVIMRAKIFIQSIWLQRLEWDDPLQPTDIEAWQLFLGELPLLSSLRIPRWLGCRTDSTSLRLHGFADASERGYAAAVYLCSTDGATTVVRLLAAKSKVAPVKQVSLPRLELCAAALLTRLACHIRLTLGLAAVPITLWSDSQVTLHWIRGHSSRWKTFVANRVADIQQRLPDAQWRHVPGRDNPADCGSRGIAPRDLIDHPLWWSGPAWLTQGPHQWPDEQRDISDVDAPERRTVALTATAVVEREPEIITRFSSLHALLRVTSWCLRWRHVANRTPNHILDPRELEDALRRLITLAQGHHYPLELREIAHGRPVSARSHLRPLSPFLDTQGVLRVGGRLRHALLAYDEKHPVILPPEAWVTKLLVESCHRRTLHGGVQLTLGLLRGRYWLPKGRAVIKRTVRRCIPCTKWRAASLQPPMGDLPRSRVTPTRPFLHTGLDYAGPILVRTSKGRGVRSHKAFIAVFVCMSSRAVHLEAVSDYTSDAFLAAFRRFTARRGLITDIYSDCGTNFVGADRALRELFRASSASMLHITHNATDTGLRWHFNPPAAPHFGGLWEAAVRSVKHHLRRVIGDTTLTFEELSTLLAQIEACLNSRPLQALTDDPEDVSALTPGHFIIGAPLMAVPEPSLSDTRDHQLTRFRRVQKMRDHFWQRWSQEYLHGLTTRPKWTTPEVCPAVGALCLIRAENTPPTRWPLARVTQLHPGADHVVRVVTVRTRTGEIVRPVVKLVFLPCATPRTT